VRKSVSEGPTTVDGSRPSPGLDPADERLLSDLRRRTPDSLDRLHGLYAVGIFNLALRMVHHRQDAEDITHDVLIRAYERLPRDREVRLRPWLYRMTLNRCYDHLRAAARRRPVDPERHDCDVAAPGDPFEQAELGALFERTLETMSTRQQAALLLKDVHGFSTAELAAMLEVTPGSAEVLLARARTSFRGHFADIAGVEKRAVPAWIGASLVLPLMPLPTGLLKPPLPPVPAPVHPLPDLSHVALGAGYAAPVGAAGGSIGSLLANSAALKLAAVVAAAATMSVGVSDAHHLTHHGAALPRTAAASAAATTHPAATHIGSAAQTGAHTPRPTPTPTLAATAIAASPTPTAAAPASPSPTPTGSQLGDTGYTPSPTATPTETPTPTPSATASATPTASPTPSAEPSTTASPTPTPAPSY
jgi:RNA polymerase sigma factor (sigma-70 family)